MTSEKQNLTPMEKTSFLYDKYKEHFPQSFLHNLFWKLLVDKTRKLTDAAFTPVIKSGYMEIGIADKGEKGYSPTMVIFETHKYDEAQRICTRLNQDVFGITEDQSDEIVFSTMSK